MASILGVIQDIYDKVDAHGDPRVKDWIFMKNPTLIIVLIVSYNIFVLNVGPKLMAKRKGFELKPAIFIYNIVQIVLNAFFVYEAVRLQWLKSDWRFSCMEVDYSDTPLGRERASTVWLFFVSRLVDLVDTIFFVLRKKQNQVTFLHVYHHSAVAFFTWMAVKFVPGGHGVFFGTINSFIHVVMYGYYLLTLFHPVYKQAWWKKYLTQMQMAQFVIVGAHAIIAMLDVSCNYPKGLIIFALPQDVFMFILFYDFYQKAYGNKSKKAEKKIS